ncbi:MAG: 3-phosphoshikimate 1-carboxyvinyltransferase [Flavobacteriales bacterium]|nr:MAG: 3-phosphoshikimate 1-carboxyvinyltransferase [Flavobacteriales bacterium]
MNLFLDYSQEKIKNTTIKITGSKSESNRLLILQQHYPDISIKNLSNSDDTTHLQQALKKEAGVVDIGHAGTAMRFLTAYFSAKDGVEVTLTGSQRMQERPVKILVDALRTLGADLEYKKNDGYPPLRIKGKKIIQKKVSIKGNVSSQYLTALVLIAPNLENGLTIELIGEITSRPYLEMTLALLRQLGIKTSWEGRIIKVFPQNCIGKKTITVESDWSSASYFYSLVALGGIGDSLTLSSYKEESLQGDSCLTEIYKNFGVATRFKDGKITITKISNKLNPLLLDLRNAPDIAQTIAVTCFGLGMACDLTGLHTLKIKETDRLAALKIELEKMGGQVKITEDSLQLHSREGDIKKNITIQTYNDHRMAMAFASLALKVPIKIADAEVVSKSYPGFWEDLETCVKN